MTLCTRCNTMWDIGDDKLCRDPYTGVPPAGSP